MTPLATRSGSFPGWNFGKKLKEPGDLGVHVVADIVLVQESGQGLLEEPLPRLVFVAGIDREKEHAVVRGGLHITRGIADHEDAVGLVAADGGQCEVLALAAQLLSGDEPDHRP